MIEGPAGLASPRWSCSYEDALGRTICETRPGFRGALLVTSNEYNTANQLVATRAYVLNENATPTPLTYTYLFCYNFLGQRCLTDSDMNLNSQIDWNETDRIYSPGSDPLRPEQVPPGKPHWPISGSHVHFYEVNQSPVDKGCVCFWRNLNETVASDSPPKGMVNIKNNPVRGGGIRYD